MGKIGLIKCRNCHYCSDVNYRKPNGETVLRPYCERIGKVLPDYDYSPEQCFWFSFSSDALQELDR